MLDKGVGSVPRPNFRKEDRMLSAQISRHLRILSLCLSAQEYMNVRDWIVIKNMKQLVDVSPHWGEPRISCVVWFLCAVLFIL